MCNLIEIVERVKETGLDAVLAHMGLRAEQLRARHASMGAELGQKPRAELGPAGVVATNYREFIKRLAEWRSLCDRKFHSLTLSGVSKWMLEYARKEHAIRAIQATYDVLSRLSGTFADRLQFMKHDDNHPTPGALILTTMHSSKGLEWDHV